jgi:hypothetical protein
MNHNAPVIVPSQNYLKDTVKIETKKEVKLLINYVKTSI